MGSVKSVRKQLIITNILPAIVKGTVGSISVLTADKYLFSVNILTLSTIFSFKNLLL